jgi:hypothetical protein
MDPTVLGAGIIYLIWLALILVLTIVWTILPFAIFGTKPLLRELIAEVRHLRILLARRATEVQLPPISASRD